MFIQRKEESTSSISNRNPTSGPPYKKSFRTETRSEAIVQTDEKKKQVRSEAPRKKEGVPLDTLGTPIYEAPQYDYGRA